MFCTNFGSGNGDDAAADDDLWDDASDSEGHSSVLDREWTHRQSQFLKVCNDFDFHDIREHLKVRLLLSLQMGYRDGITEGQKDAAQEGFNIGFSQSVHVGYKWGLVRGITRYSGFLLVLIAVFLCRLPFVIFS